MPTKKLLTLACALALSGLTVGCLGRGDAPARAARSARAPRPAPSAIDAYSPLEAAPRPAAVPAETFQAGLPPRPDDFGDSPDAAVPPPDARDRLAGYSRPGDPADTVRRDERLTHARLRMRDEPQEEEEVLYSASRPAFPGASSSALSDKPFAGAPVGRTNFSRPVREQPARGKQPWEEGAPLFGGDGAAARERPAVPNIYANRAQRMDEETMWPAGTAMVPPASAHASPPPVLKTEARLPVPAPKPSATATTAAPSRASAPVPSPAAAQESADDEIFSPSMYLGAGR